MITWRESRGEELQESLSLHLHKRTPSINFGKGIIEVLNWGLEEKNFLL